MWELQDRRIVSAAKEVTSLLYFTLNETKVPENTQTEEETSLFLVSLSPLKLINPLLNIQFLSPTAAYSFIKARAAAMKLTAAVQPLLTWIKGSLLDVETVIEIMGAIDLEECFTRGRRNNLKNLTPEALPQTQELTTYIMQAAPRSPPPPATSKKAVTPAEWGGDPTARPLYTM